MPLGRTCHNGRDGAGVGRLDGGRRRGRTGIEPGQTGGLGPGGGALGQTAGQVEGAGAGAHAGLVLNRAVGHEGDPLVVIAQLAAGLAEQMHHRRQAAGDHQQVTGQGVEGVGFGEALVVAAVDAGAGHARHARGAPDHAAGHDAQAGGAGLLGQAGAGIGPAVHDGGDLHPGGGQRQRGFIGSIVVGEQHRAAARQHGEALQIGLGGAGQHDAGPVVVAEHQRAFVRAGGQHDPPRADVPQPLARQAGRALAGRQVVGQAFQRGQRVAVVIAEDRGARQQAHVRTGAQPGLDARHPVRPGSAVDGARQAQQRAAQALVLVGQDDARARARRRPRRRQPGRAGADHQHVAMDVAMVVAVRVGLVRRDAEAGGAADHGFVDVVPHPRRAMHDLVVEARAHDPRGRAHGRAQVAFDRGPNVDAVGLQPVHQRADGGPHVGIGARRLVVGVALDQGARVLHPGGHDAARPVVFHGPTDQMYAVGHQGAGQRVARMAVQPLAVEAKPDGPRPVDQAALGAPEGLAGRLAHRPPSPLASGSLGRRLAHAVDRQNAVADGIAQHVEPAPAAGAWLQRSANRPLGLSRGKT